jgi:tetrahydromethanopterin S-methyltransferase subunit G
MTAPYTSGSSSIEPEPQREELSLGERFSNVTRDISTLMRQEVALAKAEVSESAGKAGKGIGLLAGAAVAGFFVLMFLSISLWRALGNEIGFGWSALIVAVIWAIIAAILAVVGKKALQQVRGVPETADSLGKIPNALKGQEEKNL